MGMHTQVQSIPSVAARGGEVEVRHGAGTCDEPCILGRVLDSTFMQARVSLS